MASKRKVKMDHLTSFDIEAYKAKIKSHLQNHPDDDLAREEWELLSRIQENKSEMGH